MLSVEDVPLNDNDRNGLSGVNSVPFLVDRDHLNPIFGMVHMDASEMYRTSTGSSRRQLSVDRVIMQKSHVSDSLEFQSPSVHQHGSQTDKDITQPISSKSVSSLKELSFGDPLTPPLHLSLPNQVAKYLHLIGNFWCAETESDDISVDEDDSASVANDDSFQVVLSKSKKKKLK